MIFIKQICLHFLNCTKWETNFLNCTKGKTNFNVVMDIMGHECSHICKTWKICGKRIFDSISGINMGRSVKKTSKTYDTGKQIRSNVKNMSVLRYFQMRECMTGDLCWNIFFATSLPYLEIFFASSPSSLEICKGQKIENTRPTLILILKKKI